MPEYKDELPFEASLMVHFRKRLTPEILGEINEMIIVKAEKKLETPPDEEEPTPPNKGTLIVDATCGRRISDIRRTLRCSMKRVRILRK
jgi:IS5 family transposase